MLVCSASLAQVVLSALLGLSILPASAAASLRTASLFSLLYPPSASPLVTLLSLADSLEAEDLHLQAEKKAEMRKCHGRVKLGRRLTRKC